MNARYNGVPWFRQCLAGTTAANFELKLKGYSQNSQNTIQNMISHMSPQRVPNLRPYRPIAPPPPVVPKSLVPWPLYQCHLDAWSTVRLVHEVAHCRRGIIPSPAPTILTLHRLEDGLGARRCKRSQSLHRQMVLDPQPPTRHPSTDRANAIKYRSPARMPAQR